MICITFMRTPRSATMYEAIHQGCGTLPSAGPAAGLPASAGSDLAGQIPACSCPIPPVAAYVPGSSAMAAPAALRADDGRSWHRDAAICEADAPISGSMGYGAPQTRSSAADRSIAPNEGHYPIVRAGGAKALPAQGAYACWSTARALFRSSVAITIFAGPNVV